MLSAYAIVIASLLGYGVWVQRQRSRLIRLAVRQSTQSNDRTDTTDTPQAPGRV